MADDLSDDLEEAVGAAERTEALIKRLDEILEIVGETGRKQREADEAKERGEAWTAEK